ncbi:hypothetical protein [Sinomonas sp. G460-2]|uniref:hypothetical protein n=1 Tax=Sinomonas sp. G460-2 TaxID=3393464 RepID=UPI0039EE18ED
MDVVISAVFKYWLGQQRASTQLISVPRSRVLGQAALTAVWGSPAWVRIADGRSSAWYGEAPFGGESVLRATTDLVVLQVWAEEDVKAAAVGTLFLSSPYSSRLSEIDAPAKHYSGLGPDPVPAEQSSWVGYNSNGVIAGVHSLVRYEGADPLPRDEVERVLRGSSNAREELSFTPVEPTELLATGRVRVDPATRRLVVD